jgi:type II secretory pathway component GspD/PulD (secretin)
MQWKSDVTGRRRMNYVRLLIGLTLAVMLFAPCVGAQTPPADTKPAEAKPAAESYQTLYLNNLTQQNELTDIQTDLRNLLPKARMYALQSQNAISMRGTAEDIQLAQKILAELDRPRKIYRLTYTITETDNGKRIRAQHLVLIATSGIKTFLRQGSKVPVFVGENNARSADQKVQYAGTQVEYKDVGLTIEATLNVNSEGVSLRTKVEQSRLAEEKSGLGDKDPVIHQTVLEGTSTLLLGKPLVLGSLDIPGTSRNLEIEVVPEFVL